MSARQRILIAGTGGQGVLSTGRWIGAAAHACGLTVVVAEQHGMAQRGGAVQASVGLGVRAPEIPDGQADVLVALEPLEAARALAKVSRRTSVLANTRPILPASLQSARRPYPPLDELFEPLRAAAGSLLAVDATALAERAGSARCLNVVMLGMLASAELLPLPAERLLAAVLDATRGALAELNRRGFRLGAEALARARAS